MPSRRILILLLVLFSGVVLRAEDRQGNAAKLVRETNLKREPSEESASVGRLPKATILQLLGERRNGYAMVSVELEDGQFVEGWIRVDSLNRKAREGEDVDEPVKTKIRIETDEDEEEAPKRPRSKIVVPKDEGLLLKREYSFFYGLRGGANYSIMNAADNGIVYPGIGFGAGAHIGIFVDRNIPLTLELGYSQTNGAGEDGGLLEFGFFDVGATAGYLIDRVEVYGGLQYSYGLSLNDIPKEIKLETAADLSSIYGMGGIGYRILVGEFTEFIIRGRYAISLLQAPVFFQVISLFAVLEFSG